MYKPSWHLFPSPTLTTCPPLLLIHLMEMHEAGGVYINGRQGGDICSFMFVHWVQISMIDCVHFSSFFWVNFWVQTTGQNGNSVVLVRGNHCSQDGLQEPDMAPVAPGLWGARLRGAGTGQQNWPKSSDIWVVSSFQDVKKDFSNIFGIIPKDQWLIWMCSGGLKPLKPPSRRSGCDVPKRSARFFFVDVRVESIFWGPSAQAGSHWALHTRRGSKRCKETCFVCHPPSSREFRIKVQTHQIYMTACKLLRILGFVIAIWFHPVLKFTASPESWGGPHCSTYLPALNQPNTVECDWNILRGSEWPMCRRVLMIFCSYPLVIFNIAMV